nr:ABC transporter ATP-binding protein [uncultured Roseateles sp.]
MTGPLLSVRGLVKRYGALLVSDAIDLDIAAGEVLGIIGPNGAGKTTLINQLQGELPSDAGTVLLEGRDVSRWPVHARARAGLARSYQITAVLPEFSVLENLLLAVQARHGHNFRFWQPVTRAAALVEEANQLLERVGLAALGQRPAGLLSYGQQRQLELAMALALRPRVLLLDEPMAGLSAAETQQMVELLQSLQGAHATLLVEHDMAAVFALATRISVLVYGRIVFSGTPQEVRSSTVVREAYLGDEEMPV